jgi:hypothetical protein
MTNRRRFLERLAAAVASVLVAPIAGCGPSRPAAPPVELELGETSDSACVPVSEDAWTDGVHSIRAVAIGGTVRITGVTWSE